MSGEFTKVVPGTGPLLNPSVVSDDRGVTWLVVKSAHVSGYDDCPLVALLTFVPVAGEKFGAAFDVKGLRQLAAMAAAAADELEDVGKSLGGGR